MPAPKRKNQISPRSKKEIAASSKFRKGDKKDLPTGNDEEEQFEDMELSFETAKNSPTKKVPLKSTPISVITIDIVKVLIS